MGCSETISIGEPKFMPEEHLCFEIRSGQLIQNDFSGDYSLGQIESPEFEKNIKQFFETGKRTLLDTE